MKALQLPTCASAPSASQTSHTTSLRPPGALQILPDTLPIPFLPFYQDVCAANSALHPTLRLFLSRGWRPITPYLTPLPFGAGEGTCPSQRGHVVLRFRWRFLARL